MPNGNKNKTPTFVAPTPPPPPPTTGTEPFGSYSSPKGGSKSRKHRNRKYKKTRRVR